MSYKNSTYKKIYHLKRDQYIGDLKKFKFPQGIIEKGETGIGTTQGEIKAKRNSSLYLNVQSLESFKWAQSTTKYFVISSKINL